VIGYIVRRVLLAIPVLWGVATLVFLGVHLIPGDPAQVMLFGRGTAQDVARLRHELGLDQPLLAQYWSFLAHAAHLDFGRSITSHEPVWSEIGARFPYTLALASCAVVVALALGVPSGMLAARFNHNPVGMGITGAAVLGISVPDFWLGTMLALVFGVKLGWLPVTGSDGGRSVVLPACTLAIGIASIVARLTRTALMESLAMDYVRTARAKGAGRSSVLFKHALRPTLVSLVTVLGLIIAGLLGGVVVVENVFAWPGLGSLAVSAVTARDYPVVEGTTFLFSIILIAANLLVDLSYALLDPRIRHAGA
jgi:peptide/nickel transport system permease protein